MLISIDKIIVGDRIRKDFGDIEELAEDIKRNGLINPPTINKGYVLLAGERRLKACKSLGWTQIEVHMLDTKDEAHDLDVEMSENNMRRNFTGSELAEGIRRQMAIESEKARERMAEGGRGGNVSTPSSKARDKAGEAFGISGKQAEKVVFVDEHRDMLDPADFAEWDEGKLSTNKAYQRIKAAQKKAEQERDAANDALEDAYRTQEALEDEIEALKRQPKPEPEVIEREVVPEKTKQLIRKLEQDSKQHTEEYEKLRNRYEGVKSELEHAHMTIEAGNSVNETILNVQCLVYSLEQVVRQYDGITWNHEHLGELGDATKNELTKSIRRLTSLVNEITQEVA